jgi:hypothetical protein
VGGVGGLYLDTAVQSPAANARTKSLSIPSRRHQPVELVGRHLELLDRLRNRRLFVQLIVRDADELGRGQAGTITTTC